MVYWCVPNPIILYSAARKYSSHYGTPCWHFKTEDHSLCSVKKGKLVLCLLSSHPVLSATLTAAFLWTGRGFLEPSRPLPRQESYLSERESCPQQCVFGEE